MDPNNICIQDCSADSCVQVIVTAQDNLEVEKDSTKIVIIIVCSVVGSLLILAIASLLVCCCKMNQAKRRALTSIPESHNSSIDMLTKPTAPTFD